MLAVPDTPGRRASTSASTVQGGDHPLLRGEMFKTKTGDSAAGAYKLRWFELFSDGVLMWSDAEGTPPKNSISLKEAMIALEPVVSPPDASKVKAADAEPRFGIRIMPTSGAAKMFGLRCSSAEERKIWVEGMDSVSHAVPSYSHGSACGRTVRLTLPVTGPIGVDLGADSSSPCVTICALAGIAARSGLLVGDVIVALDTTVLRTLPLAERSFSRARGTVTLRLAGWNREVRLIKQAGHAGLTLCTTTDSGGGGGGGGGDDDGGGSGEAVVVQSVVRDSAAHSAGLNPGDRVLAVNGVRCGRGHEPATAAIRASLQEVRLVVSGYSVAVPLRKDTDGRLGLGFAHSGPSLRGVRGAVITDVMPHSAAHTAGLRNGDVLVSVDGSLVSDQQSGLRLLSTAERALVCVVWRPKPDETTPDAGTAGGRGAEAAAAAAGGGGGSGSGGSGSGAEQGVAVDVTDDQATEPLTVGTVPYAYYSHNVLPGGSPAPLPLPGNVLLYEDLTAPAAQSTGMLYGQLYGV